MRLTTLIDISADDDLSETIDFGIPVRLLWVYVPTITSGTVNIQASPDSHIDSEDDTPGTFAVVSTDILGGAGTGAAFANLDAATDVAGFRYFKIATSSNQGADRTIILGAVPC